MVVLFDISAFYLLIVELNIGKTSTQSAAVAKDSKWLEGNSFNRQVETSQAQNHSKMLFISPFA